MCYVQGMPVDLIVDLDDATIAALQRRADANGRSLEDEHRAILEEAFGHPSTFDAEHRARWAEHAAELRRQSEGREFTPSEVLVREAREER